MAERTQLTGGNGREARIGEIVDGFLLRRSRGETVSKSGLLARHPDLADELREHFELIEEIRPAQAGIDDLIARGLLHESTDERYLAELGPYRILEVLGRGGMGIVLKAHEESLNRSVALKILRPDLSADTNALVRFTREAKAAAALHHPNIVTVHAVGSENGAQFMAMEYIEGPTLGETIRERGALPAETAREIFRQLLSALATAHAAGLIHRDIKPSNILLDGSHQLSGVSPQQGNAEPGTPNPEPSIKLADFGLARMMSAQTRMTQANSVLGTPEYMSPEQARGDAEIDQRTDLYSAGVVLYEMLTGCPPFKADTPTAVIHQILYDEPPDPRSLQADADPQLAALARQLMRKSPDERPASAGAVLAALIRGTPARPANRTARFLRNRRIRVRLSFGLLGVVAVILGVYGMLQYVPDSSLITDVMIDRDTGTISVLYEDDLQARFFLRLEGTVLAPKGALPHVPGRRQPMIVVGMHRPGSYADSDTLVAFDDCKNRLWAIPLDSEAICSEINPARYWPVAVLLGVDLDGRDGDELLVVARHPELKPARLSVVEPETGEIRWTLWHGGHLADVQILEEFPFDQRRLAGIRHRRFRLCP